MTALYIVAGILFLFGVLLSLHVRIYVLYKKKGVSDDGCSASVAVGPVRIKLYPKNKKKVKLSDFTAAKYRKYKRTDSAADREKKPEKPKQKDEKKKNLLSEISSLPGGLGEAFELVIDVATKFTSRLKCEIMQISLDVGAPDAASTALLYTGVSAAVGFLIEFLDVHTRLRMDGGAVSVRADFVGGDVSGIVSVRFRIRVINIFRAGWGFAWHYLLAIIKADKKSK